MSEDIRYVLDWVLTAALAIGGWAWTFLFNKLREMKNEVKEIDTKHEKEVQRLANWHVQLEKTMLQDYAKKTDVDKIYDALQQMRLEIKADLQGISNKLDTKQDK